MTRMADDVVLRRLEGVVAVFNLTRPARSKTFESECHALGLEEALRVVDADTEVHAMVLTSGGGWVFCVGGDFGAILEGCDTQRVPLTFALVVTAVNGSAMGAGCDLIAARDIRAREMVAFSQAFEHLRLISGDGSPYYLPCVICHVNAVRMALAGEVVDTVRALAWGLVSEVLAREAQMDSGYAGRVRNRHASRIRGAHGVPIVCRPACA